MEVYCRRSKCMSRWYSVNWAGWYFVDWGIGNAVRLNFFSFQFEMLNDMLRYSVVFNKCILILILYVDFIISVF